MFCNKCGAQMPDNQKFCTSCGNALTQQGQVAEMEVVEYIPPEKPIKEKKKIKKGYIALIAVFVILIGISVAIVPGLIARIEMQKTLDDHNGKEAWMLYNGADYGSATQKQYLAAVESYADKIMEELNSYDFDSLDYDSYGDDYIQGFYNFCSNKYGDLLYSDYGYTLTSFLEDIAPSKFAEFETVLFNKERYFWGMYILNVEKDYDEALETFLSIGEADSHKAEANEKVTVCLENIMSETTAQIQEAIKEKNYEYASEIVEEIKEGFEYLTEEYGTEGLDASALEESLNASLAKEAAVYAEKAETEFYNKDINAAVGNMEVSLTLQPDNADYKAKMEEYKKYLPFKLYDVDKVLEEGEKDIYDGKLYHDTTRTSNVGEDENHCIEWYNDSKSDAGCYYVKYLLKGGYDTIKGKFFLCSITKNIDGYGYFEVYGDGKLLYTSSKMSKGKEPINVSIDCSGVYELELRFHAVDELSHWSSNGPTLAISNLIAQKNIPDKPKEAEISKAN